MRLDKFFIYLGVVALLCALSFSKDVVDDDEDDVEVDSDSESEEKARRRSVNPFRSFR